MVENQNVAGRRRAYRAAPSADDRRPGIRVERILHGLQQERLFELAADVERYPEFLDWWIAARILRREANIYYTNQTLGVGPLRVGFVSRTTLYRPERIDVTTTAPAFRRFELSWSFAALPDAGCRVSIAAIVEPRLWLLRHVVDQALPRAVAGIATSFEARARKLAAIEATR